MPKNNSFNGIEPLSSPNCLLERSQVEKLLRDAFKKPLTTVIAGAGYGKTRAVLAALTDMRCKSAWMQLSRLDNHIARFWERFSYAFKPHSRRLFEQLTELGFPESLAAFDSFLRILTKELGSELPFIFIFDDFHLIYNELILNFIELFIYALVENFSIVIISRTKPKFCLATLLSKGLLTLVSEDDLRFQIEELWQYFALLGIECNEKMIKDIYSYTDGWIFAVYLIGLALKKGDMHYENPIMAAKIDIFELIEKEVFSLASQRLQNLLIKVSILDFLPAGLLKKLANNNRALILEMLDFSLFIRYDSFQDSYHMHHLLKEFLLEHTNRLTMSQINKIHLTAAKWNFENDRKFEAIEHYEKCGLYDKVFDIMLSITHSVPREAANSFINLIDKMPEEMLKKRPILKVARAKYIFNNNMISEAKAELLKLRRYFEKLPKTKENCELLGEVYLGLAFIGVINIDYSFIDYFKLADKFLPNGSKLVYYNRANLADGANVCSIKDPSAGELERHKQALFEVAPYAARVLNGTTYGIEYLNAAESSLYTGDLRSAEKYTYEAIFRSRKSRQYAIELMANFVLIRIFTAKGSYKKIAEILKETEHKLENPRISDCIPLYEIIKGWFLVKIGDTSGVAKWIRSEEDAQKILPPVILGREYLVRSDCLLAEGRYYELLAFMKHTDEIYEKRGILFARIQNKITKAIIHHYTDNREGAILALNEAYTLTRPNDLNMQYIEYGNQMRTLIHNAKKSRLCEIPNNWLDKIYTRSSTYAKQLSQVISDYCEDHPTGRRPVIELSRREIQAINYIARGLTREEIAQTLFLAIGTVNDIINNVYTKLGASNAADAIRIAKEIQLI